MKKFWPRAFSFVLIAVFVMSFVPAARPAYASASGVVISQVYGGGGNSGATYKNDFIELYNAGSTAVNLTGWSVQYASSGGSSWQRTNLSAVSLQSGHYYLVQEAAGTGGTTYLPAPDATGTIPMSSTAGKVALVTNTTTLTGTCPTANIADFVGFGTGTNCFEGAGPTATLSNTTAALRNGNGTVDANNNAADFTVGAPNPRNSLFPFAAVGVANPTALLAGTPTLLTVTVSPATDPPSTGITVSCNLTPIGGGASQPLYDDGTNGDRTAGDNVFSFLTPPLTVPNNKYTITCAFADAQGHSSTLKFDIILLALQTIGSVNGPVGDTDNGTAHLSPFNGKQVLVQGVIYETTLQATSGSADSFKGFFLQSTASTTDGNPNTSDGLFVFMNTADTLPSANGPYTPKVGDEVMVAGTISEFFNMTELQAPYLGLVELVQSGLNVESEVPAAPADPPANLADANRYWERLQGMRVQVPQNSIVLGGRNVFSPADAEVWVARPDSTIAGRENPYARRAFRDAHPLDDNYDPSNWDGNGYRILMGSLGIKSAAGDAQALIDPGRTFDTVTNSPAGGLNYTFSKYRIEISGQPIFSEGPDPAQNNPPTEIARSQGYSIVDYNLENLYDYRNNPFSGCDFASDTGCPQVAPFLAPINPPYDYVPASDAAYQARLSDIAKQIINDLHSPDILMLQEVENQDVCTVSAGAVACGGSDNADGKPDVLQDLAVEIAAQGGPAYDAAFDRNSSDLRGILPAFLYRTDRVQLASPVGDPVLGTNPQIGNYTPVPYDADVSNPKTLNAIYTGTGACETSWVFPRAPDVALFRIYDSGVGLNGYRDVYVIDNHFKSGPDTCVAHRTEQAKYNAALVAYIQGKNPLARIAVGGDLNVYPRPDDIALGATDQLGALYDPSLGLKNLWEVLLDQAPEAAYSYVFQGMAQTLDQIFVNQLALADLNQYRIAHINSDFPAEYPGDVARGTSDHDPNVANFKIPYFGGFSQPVDNLPELNVAKAGSIIPVKFSLGGDKGLDIFAAGYPLSTKIKCDTTEPQDQIEETMTSGASGLQYDPTADQYIYAWKTERAWAGTCRQFTMMMADGTVYQANFTFTK